MTMRRLTPVLLVALIFAAFVIITLPTAAQRPGRATPAATVERGGNSANRTPIATIDRSGSSANRTPIATPDSGSPTRERPDTTSPTLTPFVTFSIPSNPAITPRATRQQPASSAEADAALNGFASTYLGTGYAWLYTGNLDSSNASPEAVAAWNAAVAQLPAEVQSYIALFSNAAAGSYWGVFQTGSGMVTVGDCTNNPNCIVTIDNLDFYLTSASAGVYTSYMAGAVSSANDALNLIHATYPALSGIALEAVSAEQGFAFQAVTYGTSTGNQQVQATSRIYIAGAIAAGNQALVYAVVGVGDGYVNLMR